MYSSLPASHIFAGEAEVAHNLYQADEVQCELTSSKLSYDESVTYAANNGNRVASIEEAREFLGG